MVFVQSLIHARESKIMLSQYLNKIIHGDCMEILKQLPDKSVDCVFIDPPYKQEFHDRGMAKERPNYKKMAEYGSNKDIDYTELFEILYRKLKQLNLFVFCDKETKFEFIKLAKKIGGGTKKLLFVKHHLHHLLIINGCLILSGDCIFLRICQ